MLSVKWGDLTSPEIRATAEAGGLAIIPLGCTEQHGHHLPVDTDTYQVEKLAVGAAQMVQSDGVAVLVLPPLPFGPATEHLGYPGTISVDSGAYILIIKNIVSSVLDSGFHRIAVIHGCGGHWVVPGALWDAKAEATRSNRAVIIRHIGVSNDWETLRRRFFPGSSDAGGGHAGVMETALCLAGRQNLVRFDKHQVPKVDRLDERYRRQGEVFLFSEITDTGALGDANGATAEGGAQLWDDMTGRFAALLRELAAADGVSNNEASSNRAPAGVLGLGV
jgi:creatinine amidohydrolase/Fe(II)-dependent formamide hydrolase-like protein